MTFFLVTLLVLFACNAPVAFAMMGTAIAFMLMRGTIPLLTIPQKVVEGMNSFVLLSVPFFLLAGVVMNTGGITARIFRFARTLVGHIRGGLGHANVVAGMIMAGMSGSAQADAAGLGQIAIDGMRREGYDVGFSASVTAAAATIGPIIPPSIILVIYGSLGGVSVGALLIGGILPGVLMGICLMTAVWVISGRRGYPIHARASLREVLHSARETIWALLAPVILIGGILSGYFTPTEAGAVAAIYAFIVAAFVYREIGWADIPRILGEVAIANAGIMLIIGAAAPFGWSITWEGIPRAVADAIFDISRTQWVVLLLINVALLIAGMFMEGIAILTVLMPVLRELAVQTGVDLVHFGLVVCLNLMIGTLTPPVGVVAYIICIITNLSFPELMKDLWPFIVALIVALAVITYFPPIVLILPKLVFG